ncbi:MAG: RsiV family protein [Candidatus Xenobiia bacterium LiM19]
MPGREALLLQKLSALSEKFLKEKLGDKLGTTSEGWAPKAENFQNVCLTSKGLKIYFRYYQVGARYLGSPDILIPWTSIYDLLTPEVKELMY